MLVVNLLGAPCVGKTTIALGLAHELKKLHYNVAYIPEYAQEMVWEKRHNILNDQIYIFAKQNRRLSRLLDHKMDFVVTDSPLPTSLLYLDGSDSPFRDAINPPLTQLITTVFRTYNNLNIRLIRNPKFEYNPNGRNQKKVEEAQAVDRRLDAILEEYEIAAVPIVSDDDTVLRIVETVTGRKVRSSLIDRATALFRHVLAR